MKDLMSKLAGEPSEEQDSHATAKMQVLQELRDMALGMMGGKMKSAFPDKEMHGVEVMAPDQKGLHAGLEMAQHALPGDEQNENPDEEASESPSEEADEEMSPKEIDAEIARLEEMKRQVMQKA